MNIYIHKLTGHTYIAISTAENKKIRGVNFEVVETSKTKFLSNHQICRLLTITK